MEESQSFSIRDKFLALGVVVMMLVVYVLFALKGIDTTFIENALLFALGLLGGLLKGSTQANTNVDVRSTGATNISKPTIDAGA
jgi:hypothetical protein